MATTLRITIRVVVSKETTNLDIHHAGEKHWNSVGHRSSIAFRKDFVVISFDSTFRRVTETGEDGKTIFDWLIAGEAILKWRSNREAMLALGQVEFVGTWGRLRW